MFKRVFNFCAEMVETAVDKIVGFLSTAVKHTEAIGILTLSAVGLNSLIGEVPFLYTVPMWIEAPMIIPTLSVVAISLLVWSMQNRNFGRRVAVRA